MQNGPAYNHLGHTQDRPATWSITDGQFQCIGKYCHLSKV